MKRSIHTLVFILLLSCFISVNGSAATGNAVEDACKGVVRVFCTTDQGIPLSCGSGFLVGKAGESSSYIITNRHVVLSPENFNVVEPYIYIGYTDDALIRSNLYNAYTGENEDVSIINTSKVLKAEVIFVTTGLEDEADFAVLKTSIDIPDHIALPLISSSDIHQGQKVYSLGFPGTSDTVSDDNRYASPEQVTVCGGVISRLTVNATEAANLIQHDAEINHGNSGGPLVTEEGEVAGINTYGWVFDEGAKYAAISIDYIIDILTKNKIPFELSGMKEDVPTWFYAVIAAIAVVFVLILAAVIIILKKKKKGKQQKASVSNAKTPQDGAGIGIENYRLQGVSGCYAAKRFSIQGRVRFGRNADNDVRFPDNTKGVSGFHCELTFKNGTLYLKDQKSSYGTYLNGIKLTPMVDTPLKQGDTFYLGDEKQKFIIDVKR